MAGSAPQPGYLIELAPASGSEAFLFPFPSDTVMTDDVAGVGSVEMVLGGPTWDIPREIVDSVADRIPSPTPALVRTAQRYAMPDFAQTGAVMIVSDRLRLLLSPHLTNAEFLPLDTRPGVSDGTLGRHPGRYDYYWMNVWNRLDIVDFATSEFGKGGRPEIRRFSSWSYLSISDLPSHPTMYGLLGLRSGRRFISPALHRIIRNAGMNVGFRPTLLDKTIANAGAVRADVEDMLNGLDVEPRV